MKRPELSIIIPAYNCEQYIANCLNSILRQQGADKYEIIVVNDGSTDGTADILNDFASEHENIRIISQENAGVSVARNNGIAASRGKYVTFVDADDMVGLDVTKFNEYFKTTKYHGVINNLVYKESDVPFCFKEDKPLPNWYFTDTYFINMLNAAKDTNAEVIFGGHIAIDNTKKDDSKNHIARHVYERNEVYGKEPKDKNIVLDQAGSRQNANFALYSRDMLDKYKLRFTENMNLDEDILFCMLAVLYAEKVATVQDVTYFYYRHQNTLSNIPDRMEFKRKLTDAHIRRYSILLKELSKYPEYARIFNRQMWLFALCGQDLQYKMESFPPEQCARCVFDKCTNCNLMNQISTLFQRNIDLYATKTM